jgi:molybdopterin-binding protein
MTQLRISQAARILDVSDDTVRRWIEQGKIPATRDATGRRVVEGRELATLVRARTTVAPQRSTSARNRLDGLVTDVVRDGVMAQVEIQAGRYRLVSLMSREAADELGLEPGVEATAVIKATMVAVELT